MPAALIIAAQLIQVIAAATATLDQVQQLLAKVHAEGREPTDAELAGLDAQRKAALKEWDATKV